MNERQLQNLLDQIAQEEIPDDMDLWNEIQTRVATPTRRHVKPPLRVSKYLLIAAILLVVSSTYAVYQVTRHGGDTGIVGVSEANLITDLNMTQTLADADVNATLNWAYADGHRIAIGWTVDHADNLVVPPISTIRLYDETGNEFGTADFLRGGGGGGGGGGGRTIFGSTASFDATHITGSPETLNLRLVMDFTQSNDSMMGGSGTSGGGGSGGGSSDSSATPAPTPIPRIPIEPFTMEFDFSVPFIPAVKIAEPLTAEANGITITLTDVSYAPSVTLGTLCFTRPESDPALVWRPNIQTEINGILMSTGGMYLPEGASEADPEICGELVILAPLKIQTDTLRLKIDHIQTEADYSAANLETFSQLAADAGFEIEILKIKPDEMPDMKGEGNILFYLDSDPEEGTTVIRIVKVPDEIGDNYYGVLQNLQDQAFRQIIAGPWTFEVDLTQ